MSGDSSGPPWSSQQWALLQSDLQEAASKVRIATAMFPTVSPARKGEDTVPANWLAEDPVGGEDGEAGSKRARVKHGRTLHLTTISRWIYLSRGEVYADDLARARTEVRKAGSDLGRLEDAIVFNGLRPGDDESVLIGGKSRAGSKDLLITGGKTLTGLLEAPGTLWNRVSGDQKAELREAEAKLLKAALAGKAMNGAAEQFRKIRSELNSKRTVLRDALNKLEQAQKELQAAVLANRHAATPETLAGLKDAQIGVKQADAEVRALTNDAMVSHVADSSENASIVAGIITAVQKLERAGHFGPFEVALGEELFAAAYRPAHDSLALPIDRFGPFLDGGSVHRSSEIPPQEGLVTARSGDPIELVIGSDLDLEYLQRTETAEYKLRAVQRFSLRIKELSAVCVLTSASPLEVLQRDRASTALPTSN